MTNVQLNFQIPQVGMNTQWINDLDFVIEQYYDNSNFGVASMARKMGLSERNLCYKLKQETNETPANYLKAYRLGKAYELLASKKYRNIGDVCYQTGFNNVHSFARQFRQQFGCTPIAIIRQ
ncbi:MAG: helix-turn-helix domain-containing protein [Saprospiraceae bacterium]